jgi:hypothetical protein
MTAHWSVPDPTAFRGSAAAAGRGGEAWKRNEMKRMIKRLAWWFVLLLGVAANIYFIYIATTHSSDKPDDGRPAFSIFSINQTTQD